jgi:hypothetical protein
MNMNTNYYFKNWNFFDLFPYSFMAWYYDNIDPIIHPSHNRIRKSIPNRWKDISELMLDVNFEMIKSFYEDEYLKINIDWNASKEQKAFSNWLKKAYRYLTSDRIELLKNIEDVNIGYTHKNFIKEKTYKEKYGELDRLEKILRKKDAKILTDMVKYREFFWT